MTETKKRNRAEHLYALIDALHGLKSEQGVDALMYYNDLTACELDKEYYDKAIERIEQHKAKLRIF